MNFKHSWTRRLKYVFPIMMMLGTLFGLKTTNVFAEKVIVDPSNPIQNVKNNFIIPKDVPNANTTIKVYDSGSVQKKHLAASQGSAWGNINYLTDNNVALNTRYPSFQKNYGQTSLIIDNVTLKTRIEADYGKIATYKGEKVNVKLVFSDIKLLSDEFPFATLGNPYKAAFNNANSSISKSKKRLLFYISDNLYSGFHYHTSQMNVQLVVTHDDGSPVIFDGDTFISFNSLNPIAKNSNNTQRGEYAYYHGMNNSDWYVTKDTVLTEQKSYYNNLTVVGGNNKAPFDKGLYWNDHYDELGSEKFNQATVSFRIKGSNPLFVVGGNFATWSSLSSAKISKELNEQLNKLYQTTTEVLMEKHEQIQQELQVQIPKWKKEYAIQQKELKEQEEKQRQKEKEREQLEIKKREQDLAEQQMAIEKQRLEQEKEKEAAAHKERQEQMDTLRQVQLNYLAHPQPVATVQTPVDNNQANLTPSSQRSFNGWMVGCIASLSLLLGGGTVFAFNHINQSSQADSAATTASIKEEAQEQARKEYEQQLEELLNRTNQSTTESSVENSKESDSNKTKEGSSNSTVQSNSSESSESNEVK